MSDPVDRLVRRLDLDLLDSSDGIHRWLGHAGEHALNMNDAIYGGMVLAQTIVAAGRTEPQRSVHSLSQVFLRAGKADVPLEYRSRVMYAGRKYSMLSVEVFQHDDVISHAQVGLTDGAAGPDRQVPVPEPVALEDTVNRDEFFGRDRAHDQPVLVRVDPNRASDPEPNLANLVKPAGTLPEDPLLHQAALAWVTDRGFMRTGWKPHEPADYRGATLDHSIWFHRPVVFDDWHTHYMASPTLADGRGLITGMIHDPRGVLVASTAQQGNYRPT